MKVMARPAANPTDMRHVGDAAHIGMADRADAADELERDPQSEHDEGRHGDDLPADQHVHARLREHEDIGAEHAGDGAGRTDIGNG
jgi:hypothetical protein